MPDFNYRNASDSERLLSIMPGDPVGAYKGFPEAQASWLEYERQLGGLLLAEKPDLSQAVFETLSACERLKAVIEPTPLERADKLSADLGINLYFKREDTTPVHSFKIRGAYNKMCQLNEDEKSRGVLAASAGNHAQGVALSANRLGIEATIVMPTTAQQIKIEAVEDLGAQVVLAGNNYSEAYDYSQALQADSDQTFIHPFDDPDVIAGQGTVGKEILDQLPDVTHIFVPIGGGGLISGVAQFVKSVKPDIKVIGVQAEDSNAMQRSTKVGELVTLSHVGLFAEGVAVKKVGDMTFDLTRRYVDDIITVNNDQVAAAIGDFVNETRGILEPAGALSIAGARVYAECGQIGPEDVVSAICSGANMDIPKLRYVAERSEIGKNHEAIFTIKLPEQPGALFQLCNEVVNGHNISKLKYRLNKRDEARILVGFNMRDSEDKAGFMQKLTAAEYDYRDWSDNEFVKEHLMHMMGGINQVGENESFYEVQFPEKPGALLNFLEALGDQWNISLFDYRGALGDTGKVMIGFEDANIADLEAILAKVSPGYKPVDSATMAMFL